MKTRITLVRHAETVTNKSRSFSGRLDVELSPYGLTQIKDLTAALTTRIYDAVYSSPSQRARMTVEPTAMKLGKEVYLRDGLFELDYGLLEGVARDKIKEIFPDVWDFFLKYDYFKGVTNQEDPEDGFKRFTDCLVEIARSHPNQSVLVASHGMIIRIFLCLIKRLQLSDFPEISRIKNTAITELEYDIESNSFTVLLENNTDHEDII